MTVVPPSRGPLGKINGFQLLKFLGKGTFGAVYQARREADGKIYAIKKVDTRKMTAKERAEAVNEIRVLASVAGEHVITFYEAFVEQDILYIVTEFANGGDLLQLLKNKRRAGHLPEATVWSYFIQMCLGVKTMHDNNILHRDLKAANVFMCSQSYLKLGDLGVAKVLKHDQALASTQVGTPYYVAPEVWRNKPYNSKCDMWSLGCLLYELCTFRPPFEAESMEGLARKVMKGRYEPIPNFYSQSLRTVLSKLLVVEPNYRSSVNDILSVEPILSKLGDLYAQISSQNDHPAAAVDIVSTIQVPRRFNDLTKNLPPSRYDAPGAPHADVSPTNQHNHNGAGGHLLKPRNGAEGQIDDPTAASDAGDLTRLNRHAGGGKTVANAVASAQAGAVAYQRAGGGNMPKLPQVPNGQQQQQQRIVGQHQRAGYPQHQRQRVGPDDSQSVLSQQFGGHPGQGQGGGWTQQQHKQRDGLRLPAVPGAKPPPTPSSVYSQQQGYGGGRGAVPRYADPNPNREIRMVYHKANGDSRVSIFARGPQASQHYYNPITHQDMGSAAAGSRYHSRNQPQNSQVYPRSLAAQYTAQRRRVTPSHWY